MIQVIVFYSLKDAFSDLFTRTFKTVADHVRTEDGCLQYEVFVSLILQNVFAW